MAAKRVTTTVHTWPIRWGCLIIHLSQFLSKDLGLHQIGMKICFNVGLLCKCLGCRKSMAEHYFLSSDKIPSSFLKYLGVQTKTSNDITKTKSLKP